MNEKRYKSIVEAIKSLKDNGVEYEEFKNGSSIDELRFEYNDEKYIYYGRKIGDKEANRVYQNNLNTGLTVKKLLNKDSDDIIITFGKYKGKLVSELTIDDINIWGSYIVNLIHNNQFKWGAVTESYGRKLSDFIVKRYKELNNKDLIKTTNTTIETPTSDTPIVKERSREKSFIDRSIKIEDGYQIGGYDVRVDNNKLVIRIYYEEETD